MNKYLLICLLLCRCLFLTADKSSEISGLLTLADQNLKQSVDKAMDYAGKALLLAQQENNTNAVAKAQLYLSKGYFKAGANDKALERCHQALQGFEATHDNKGKADALEQMGYIYLRLQSGDKVKEYFTQSLQLRRQSGDKKALADALNNIGIFTLHYLKNPVKAYNYYQQALTLCRTVKYTEGEAHSLNNIGNYFLMQSEIDSSLVYNLQSLALYRSNNDDMRVAVNLLIVGYLYQLKQNIPTALDYYNEAYTLSRKVGAPSVARDIYFNRYLIYKQQGNTLKSLQFYKLYTDVRDSLSNEETNRNIANLQTQFAVEKQELENRILRLNLQKQRMQLAGLVAFILLGLIATFFIVKEKRKSEKLLLNILPRQVARELKRFGKATPQTFKNVTVLFSDFANFTNMSSTIDPAELIADLSEIFTAFDNLVEEFGCERIKTIGDAYLAVCGLPITQPDHAIRMTKVAIGILSYLEERNSNNERKWNIRIGMHTGFVVGGIVGIKKYIYDVFGDTINTASRMESNSEVNYINISEDVYQLIKDDFICEERSESEIKGKGKMKMYFVLAEGKKALDGSIL